MGTPAFAVPSLRRLVEHGYRVQAVFTQPDRPQGRGQRLAASPVKQAALELNLSVHQPERIRRPEPVELLRSLAPEVIVVVGYGQIIPQTIIDIPRHGIINVHASLLPKYRGAAPIQWAIANGETAPAFTTIRIDAGLDTGDMLLREETDIGPEETAPELAARLAETGGDLLIRTLRGLEAGTIVPEPQDHAAATLAPILKKEDGRVDWTWPAARIHARARGFQPWPGIYSSFRGEILAITRCAVGAERSGEAPGTLRAGPRRLSVVCGDGSTLDLLEVQMQGRRRLPVEAFLNGYHLLEKERLS